MGSSLCKKIRTHLSGLSRDALEAKLQEPAAAMGGLLRPLSLGRPWERERASPPGAGAGAVRPWHVDHECEVGDEMEAVARMP